MAWNYLARNDNGMAWKWHDINRFLGLGLVGSFVSFCALTQKLSRNVQYNLIDGEGKIIMVSSLPGGILVA
jgi:hypothetical protein